VAASEAGGITQRIGAFEVVTPTTSRRVTFIDTPGHAAFSGMRRRGASVTDVVVLVVAADDGVKPQTLEALQQARDARVPIVVAVNKIDKDNANIEWVKQQLKDLDLRDAKQGGDTLVVEVSAKEHVGLDDLEEAVVQQADQLTLHADYKARAEAYILESGLGDGRGRVLSVLVKRGTLKVGDYVVCGTHSSRIRQLLDHARRPLSSSRGATPSTPVEVVGLTGVTPKAGDFLVVVRDQKTAGTITRMRKRAEEMRQLEESDQTSAVTRDVLAFKKHVLEGKGVHLKSPNLHKKMMTKAYHMPGESDADLIDAEDQSLQQEHTPTHTDDQHEGREGLEEDGGSQPAMPESFAAAEGQQLGLVIKADNYGSMEAIKDYLDQWTAKDEQRRDRFALVSSGVGAVTEADVEKAAVSNSFVLGFNVEPLEGSRVHQLLHRHKLIFRKHEIIYKLFDDLEALHDFHFGPRYLIKTVGRMIVTRTGDYTVTNRDKSKEVRTVAGVDLKEGRAAAGNDYFYKITRRSVVIAEGLNVLSMSVQGKKATEMPKGEGAIIFKVHDDVQPGDEIVCYENKERPPLFGQLNIPKFLEANKL